MLLAVCGFGEQADLREVEVIGDGTAQLSKRGGVARVVQAVTLGPVLDRVLDTLEGDDDSGASHVEEGQGGRQWHWHLDLMAFKATRHVTVAPRSHAAS